jgi:thiol:disulfide interchange protein DsbD
MQKFIHLHIFYAVAGLVVVLMPEIVSSGTSSLTLLAPNFSGDNTFLFPLLAFMAGVLTALTPCVYPLIPITLAVFGAKKTASRLRTVFLTTTYGLGLTLTYASLGIAAGLSGKAMGNILAHPLVPFLLAGLFVFLAASMFEVIPLYSFFTRLQNPLASMNRGGFSGAFLMGLIAGLVAAPCTGPVLSGILLQVASQQDIGWGALLLFSYSLGMGTPYLLIGAFSLQLPKTGAWMDAVKSLLGIFLLSLAFLYLRDASHVLSEASNSIPYGAFICGLLVFTGLAIGALHRQFTGYSANSILKWIGIALITTGITLRPGAPLGLPVFSYELSWLTQEHLALARGLQEKRPVLIDFSAKWCGACKQMERQVFTDPDFIMEAQRFVLLRVDGTVMTPELEKIYSKYQIQGFPTLIFLGSDGVIIHELNIQGIVTTWELISTMKKVH